MRQLDHNQQRSGGTWLMQVFTGGVLIALLTLHMIAQHFVVEGGLRSYQDVLTYIRNPFIAVLEVLFLISAVYHALLGIRAIFTDLGLKDATMRTINRSLTVLGVIMVGWGLYLTWYLLARA